MDLPKAIRIIRSMHVNNPNDYMTKRDVAQILTVLLYQFVDYELMSKAIDEVDNSLNSEDPFSPL